MMDRRILTSLLTVLTALVVAFAGYSYGPEGAGILLGLMILGGMVLVVFGRAGQPLPDFSALLLEQDEVRESGEVPLEVAEHDEEATSEAPPRLPSPYTQLAAVSIVLHTILALLLNLTQLADKLAPDHGIYQTIGKVIAWSWSDPMINLKSINGYQPGSIYQILNAVAYLVSPFPGSLTMSLFNGLVATANAFVVAKTAETLYDQRAGRWAFALAAFFPSMMVWSSLNLKDPLAWLSLSTALLMAVQLREKVTLPRLAVLVAALLGISAIRSYMMPILGVGVMLALVLVRARKLPSSIFAVLLVGGILGVLGERLGLLDTLVADNQLEQIQEYRVGLSYGAESQRYGATGDVRTVAGALAYLPRGVAFTFLAPFPWMAHNWRQALACVEVVFWYYILVQAIRAVWRSAGGGFSRLAPLFFTGMLSVIAYSLVEGNVGTALRHRAQVMLVFFIFAAGQIVRRGIVSPPASDPTPLGPSESEDEIPALGDLV
jgi:hypothetical protein